MKLVFALAFIASVAAVGFVDASSEAVQSAAEAVQSAVQPERAVREASPVAKQDSPSQNHGKKGQNAVGKDKQKTSNKGKKGKKSSHGKAAKKQKIHKKGKSAKKNNKKNVKSSQKKSGKNTKTSNKGKKNKSKGGKKSGKKVQKSLHKGKSAGRQATTCGVADVVAAIKKFIVYTNNLNQNKRIRTFLAQTQQKFSKAPTAFTSAASIISDATGGGKSCNGGTANTSVTTIYNKLTNCASTAASLCNVSLSAAENSTVTSCSTSLTSYITAFQACVANGSCSCFQSLTNLSASCENHTAILTPLTTKKNQCVTSASSGSFADCRQQQMGALQFTTQCKCPSGPVTTAAPNVATTKAVGRLFRNREFFKFNKINI